MNDPTIQVLHGDNRQVMANMRDASIDAIVTDPPYELGFMGKKWDASGIAYQVDFWRECLRVLKPGGHLLAFGGTRTYHRMAVAIEDAGFEIRDSLHWVYGSGFPKSLDVSKAIDKAAGAERTEILGRGWHNGTSTKGAASFVASGSKPYQSGDSAKGKPVLAPATKDAAKWDGWGTALKPAHEPIVLARKPLEGTVAANVLQHGTGALNIDATRIGGQEGRWPANIVFDKTAGQALDQQSGVSKSQPFRRKNGPTTFGGTFGNGNMVNSDAMYEDVGGASRFFTQADYGPNDWPFIYQAKPSKKERNAGLEKLDKQEGAGSYEFRRDASLDGKQTAPKANVHPTVKPVALMQHLIRLVTPPNGTILDPFAGSGTTLIAAIHENKNAIGIELQPEYIPIIQARIKHAQQTKAQQPKQTPLEFNP